MYRIYCYFLFLLPLGVMAQTKLINAEAYLDVKTGKLISPASILIKDGLIESINALNHADTIETVDLSDHVLLPGLIDMHTHLTADLEAMALKLKDMPADWALRGAKNARMTLMAGFTTVRDVGGDAFSDIALAKAIRRGFIMGPQVFPAGHSIGSTGGHMDLTGYAPGVAEQDYRKGVADGANELIKATRYQIKHGAKVIKIGATAGVLSFEGSVGAQQLTKDEMQSVVEEAARHGLKVAAHSHGKEGMLAAVEAGVHSIEHASMIDEEVIAAMIERGTYLVPTVYIPYGINWDALPPLLRKKGRAVSAVSEKNLARAIEAGVKVAFGTDAGVYPHGDNAREFAVLTKMGMSPLAAIQAATLNASDLLGVTDRGEIAVGKRADIIGVGGNPLTDIKLLQNVRFVMKQGVVYKMEE